jgi:hypothetical protein
VADAGWPARVTAQTTLYDDEERLVALTTQVQAVR